MSTQREHVWARLQQSGIVHGSTPSSDSFAAPWYVKTLLAISGWLASVFLLGFLGFGFSPIFGDAFASVITGSILIAVAFALLHVPNNEFYEHVALAVSLAGQALIVWAIFVNSHGETSWMLISIFQLFLSVVIPNFIHQVFTSFFASVSFSTVLVLLGVPYITSSVIMLAASWLWLHEFKYPKYMQQQRAIGYGLILSFIQIKGSVLYHYSLIGFFSADHKIHALVQPWMGELLSGSVVLYVVWHILKRLGYSILDPITIVSFLCAIFLTAVSTEAHGVTVGILVLLLGFAGSNQTLLVLGVISLLFYISSYYYLLDATLLVKSQTLLIIGLVLLAARWLILRMVRESRKVRHG